MKRRGGGGCWWWCEWTVLLEGLTLQLKSIAGDGVNPRTFPWLEPPPMDALEGAAWRGLIVHASLVYPFDVVQEVLNRGW